MPAKLILNVNVKGVTTAVEIHAHERVGDLAARALASLYPSEQAEQMLGGSQIHLAGQTLDENDVIENTSIHNGALLHLILPF